MIKEVSWMGARVTSPWTQLDEPETGHNPARCAVDLNQAG